MSNKPKINVHRDNEVPKWRNLFPELIDPKDLTRVDLEDLCIDLQVKVNAVHEAIDGLEEEHAGKWQQQCCLLSAELFRIAKKLEFKGCTRVCNNFFPKQSERPTAGTLATTEYDLIVDAMHQANGSTLQASKILGIKRTTLEYRMKKYGLKGKEWNTWTVH